MSFPALLILAFFLGSIPSGFIVGKLYGIDLRESGSGNIGATNAGRVLGKRAGVVTLFADMMKGVVAVMCASLFPVDVPWFGGAREVSALLGLTALIGHCYSPFLKFKGGKGVATGGGVFLVIAPIQTLLALAVFALTLKWTRFVSLSSIFAAICVPLFLFLTPGSADNRVGIIAAVAAAIIIYRHESNISRLRAGQEPRFK